MRGLIQRVSQAQITVDGQTVAAIKYGILLLLGIEQHDTENSADKLLNKVLNYRIFADDQQRMNLSLQDINGELLIVSQFTLVADTGKGLRPSFTPAAAPEPAKRLYHYFVSRAQEQHTGVETGVFAADMQVSLCNDGPVTFLLSS